MPRESKISARKRNRHLRDTGAILPKFQYLEHTNVKVTHVSGSGHRYEFPRKRKKENLVGKRIQVRGYRASRDQLAVGCDRCPRRHSDKSWSFFCCGSVFRQRLTPMRDPLCHANMGSDIYKGDGESLLEGENFDRDPEPSGEELDFTPLGQNGGVIYKANVEDVKGFGRHKAGEITLLITSQEVYPSKG